MIKLNVKIKKKDYLLGVFLILFAGLAGALFGLQQKGGFFSFKKKAETEIKRETTALVAPPRQGGLKAQGGSIQPLADADTCELPCRETIRGRSTDYNCCYGRVMKANYCLHDGGYGYWDEPFDQACFNNKQACEAEMGHLRQIGKLASGVGAGCYLDSWCATWHHTDEEGFHMDYGWSVCYDYPAPTPGGPTLTPTPVRTCREQCFYSSVNCPKPTEPCRGTGGVTLYPLPTPCHEKEACYYVGNNGPCAGKCRTSGETSGEWCYAVCTIDPLR